MNINDTATVKKQYANADSLNTRISIHDKYSTNKMGFGRWIFSNYEIHTGMNILDMILQSLIQSRGIIEKCTFSV